MGPLAEQTPAGVRNIGASERKRARRVGAFVTEGSRQTTDRAREEGDTREEGEARQKARVTEPSQENMDGLLQAVAEAISQAEREAAKAQEDPQP